MRQTNRWHKGTAILAGILLASWIVPRAVQTMVCMEDEELSMVSASAGGAHIALENDPSLRGSGRYLPTSLNPIYSLQTWLFSGSTDFVPVDPFPGNMVHDLRARDFRVQVLLEGYMTMDILRTGNELLDLAARNIPYYATSIYTNDDWDSPANDQIDSRLNVINSAVEFWLYDNNTTAGDAFATTFGAPGTVYWRPNLLTGYEILGLRIPQMTIYLGRHKTGLGANIEINGQLKIGTLNLNLLNPISGAFNNQVAQINGTLLANSFGGNATVYNISNWDRPTANGGNMSGSFFIGDIFGMRNHTVTSPTIMNLARPGMLDMATNSTTDPSSQCYQKSFFYIDFGSIHGSLRVKEIRENGFNAYTYWALGSTIVGAGGIFGGGPLNGSFGSIAVDGIRVYSMKVYFPGSHYQNTYDPKNTGAAAGSENSAYFGRPYVRTCINTRYTPGAWDTIRRTAPTAGCETPRQFW